MSEQFGIFCRVLIELRRELHKVTGAISLSGAGYSTSVNIKCNACPNSWNMIRTSSQVSNAGSPGAGFEKFATLQTTGDLPGNFDGTISGSVHAPARYYHA